jgi:hypothetical protein
MRHLKKFYQKPVLEIKAFFEPSSPDSKGLSSDVNGSLATTRLNPDSGLGRTNVDPRKGEFF